MVATGGAVDHCLGPGRKARDRQLFMRKGRNAELRDRFPIERGAHPLTSDGVRTYLTGWPTTAGVIDSMMPIQLGPLFGGGPAP